MSDAEKLTKFEKPIGWTEDQHLRAANEHSDIASDLREKAKKLRARQSKDDAVYRKNREKAQKMDEGADFHRELASKHTQWSRTAYRKRSDYE